MPCIYPFLYIDVLSSYSVTLPSASTTTVDSTVRFLVNALDRFNNRATATNGNVILSVTGNAPNSPVFQDIASMSDVVTVVNGFGTFNVSVQIAQTLSITLLTTGGATLVSSQSLVVKPG